jgi:hypothetical protein
LISSSNSFKVSCGFAGTKKKLATLLRSGSYAGQADYTDLSAETFLSSVVLTKEEVKAD